jgi:hypothetical protein
MSEGKSSTLAMKMVNVMKEVSRVPKRGYNEFHRYEYPLEADILDAIREKLAEQGVMWYPSVDSTEREPVGEKGNVLTTLIGKVTFVDGETGEERVIGMVGTGEDKGDKGVYKAYTGAVKYCLLKTFMISTGDDPENDSGTGRGQASGNQGRGQGSSQGAGSGGRQGGSGGSGRPAASGGSSSGSKPSSVASKAQIKAVFDFGKNQLSLTDEKMGEVLLAVRGKQTTEGITVAELDEWKKKMEGSVAQSFAENG